MLLLYIGVFLVGGGFCNGTICSKITDNGLEYFCCDNSEPQGGKCVECQHGFFSMGKGKPCKSCGLNMFGDRCAEICNCNPFLRCDNVKGCVNDSVEQNVTDTFKQTSLKTTDNEQYSAMETTTTNIESSSSISKNTLNEAHFTEKCRSSVLVVISASVGILIGVGIGVIFMFFKQIKQRNKRQDQTIAEANASFEIQRETVNAYEEIGDISLVSQDTNIYQDGENSDTSSDSSNTEQRSENTENADYLNPYQPIIPTTDPHLYMTPVTSTEATAVRSSSFTNDDKTDGSLRSYSNNLMSRPLHYVELEIITLSEDNKEPDKYVNTSINANRPTENKASTQKTQYAEIVHTV